MSALDPDREIYPRAPLKLVAFEIQYSALPRLESEQWEGVYEQLRSDLPILGPRPRHELQVSPSGAQERERGHRLMDRRRTKSVVLFNESANVEVSNYERFEDFAELVTKLLSVLNDVAGIPSVQRLGLRYIDEIEVPRFEPGAVGDWSRFIAAHLLAPAESRFQVAEYRAALRMTIHDGHNVGFRYGVLQEHVVDPNGPLRIKESPSGQFFLLDLDSFWTAPQDEYPEFDVDDVAGRLVELHAPVRELFEASITDEFRDWMRGESNAS